MIAQKTWREVRMMAFVYLVILVLMMVPAVLVWPTLHADLQRPSAIVTAFGKVGEVFGRAVDALRNPDEDAAYLSYMALQLFFKGANVAGIAAAVLLGTGLFARERESTTLEFLLSRPVSRGSILWQKVWPCALVLAVPIFVASVLSVPASNQIGFSLPMGPLMWCSVHNTLFVWAIFLVTVLASLRSRVQAHAAFAVGGVVIVQLAMYFIPIVRLVSMFRLSDFDLYGPIMAGNHSLTEMFNPFAGAALTTWLALACISIYGLCHWQLRRLEL